MANVEQAVFTSARTELSAGYHVVARSAGVCEPDARELAVWCPSHDSLQDSSPEAASINFHPLPSGAYCISRTTPAGWEYSGRGGHRVYTQCLVVPPEVLARFANNPFALLRAAMAAGAVTVHNDVPRTLDAIHLSGRAPAVDQALLARLALKPGAEAVAAMLHAAIGSVCLAVCGGGCGTSLLAGLMSCLPPELRTEFSFSTGLKFSSRRPFRVIALNDDASQQRWLANQAGVNVLDLATPEARNQPLDAWPRFIGKALARGRTALLANQLSRLRNELRLEDLDALGLQWLEELDEAALRNEVAKPAPARDTVAAESEDVLPETPPRAVGVGRAHAAHRDFEHAREAATVRPEAPSKSVAATGAALAQLEMLDDLVFEAIAGESSSLDKLHAAWPTLQRAIDAQLLAESREQYLRYALHVWSRCAEQGGLRDPERAVAALEVLSVLFDNV